MKVDNSSLSWRAFLFVVIKNYEGIIRKLIKYMGEAIATANFHYLQISPTILSLLTRWWPPTTRILRHLSPDFDHRFSIAPLTIGYYRQGSLRMSPVSSAETSSLSPLLLHLFLSHDTRVGEYCSLLHYHARSFLSPPLPDAPFFSLVKNEGPQGIHLNTA
jgi:hypothetical protein